VASVVLRLGFLILALAPAAALAGPPPNRLDPNTRAVLSAPRIHNLYWHDDWNNGAQLATSGTINNATRRLNTSGFMNFAQQYGVAPATFVGPGHGTAGGLHPSGLCGPLRAPNSITTAQLVAWLTCMVNLPGTGVPFPGFRLPISNDLYMVYLPDNTTVVDDFSIPQVNVLGQNFGPFTLFVKESCADYNAYHAFSLAVTSLFAWAVMPTRCAGNLGELTAAMSHEAIEAATDPFPVASWINNSIPVGAPGFRRLIEGEASDICSPAGAVPSPEVVMAGSRFAPYWSNNNGACRPLAGVFRLQPRAARVRAGSPTVLRLTWTTPGPWRKLRAIDLRFLRGERQVGLVRLTDDGSEDGRLSARGALVDPDLDAATVTVSRNKRRVTLRLPVAFDSALAGDTVRIDAGAREDGRRGLRQEPFRAGSVRVLRPR
jgi:hypothetical protein